MNKDKFFGLMYNVLTTIKLMHLSRAGNSAMNEHLILQEMYKYLDNWLDDFIKTLQGEELRILDIEVPKSVNTNSVEEYLLTAKNYIGSVRNLFDKSWQNSKLDELESQFNKTIYKIHFLK